MSKVLQADLIGSVNEAVNLNTSTNGNDTSVPFNDFSIVCYSKIESTLKDANNNNVSYNGYYVVNRVLTPEEKAKVKAYYDACKAFEETKDAKTETKLKEAKTELITISCDGTISHRALFSRVLCPSADNPESIESGIFIERLKSDTPRNEIIDKALQGIGYFKKDLNNIVSFGSKFEGGKMVYLVGSPKENPAHTFTV